MLYAPVYAEDGKVWLNNNLGAHYTNINHASFNPIQQATSATDHLAYGSLFQWGRKPDGHELMTYSNSTTGTAINGTTTTLSDNPLHALFITVSSGTFNWRVNSNVSLWTSVSSSNNPCPQGFRPATSAEFTQFQTVAQISNSATAVSSMLGLSLAGNRNNSNGVPVGVGSSGNYWTSTSAGGLSTRYEFATNFQPVSKTNAFGSSVRCIKN
jgi:hypothetical protein